MNPCQRIYRFLVEYKTQHNGNSPSSREICEHCNISSTSMVTFYLRKLRDLGLISFDDSHKNRSIIVHAGCWMMMGDIDEIIDIIPNFGARFSIGDPGSPPTWAISPTLKALEQETQDP